ncbi:alpha-methylacyl-CoA racemase [Centruroides vittatus]|uniref:alpha-methylacyl-CoA racemase n=1 Tax=Centruroides vittatus TaxID=120091 RepID=UPI0035109F20
MALRGIKVIELAGLAPAPFCGMILSDFGASVIRVDKPNSPVVSDKLSRGKQSIVLDLRQKDGVKILERLCKTADVLLEPFRKGVMEKLDLGPNRLLSLNEKLIYARLTGFGQNGPFSKMAGHDINYLALSGVLYMIGRKNEKPYPPINLLADFAGGGMLCALGICLAIIERNSSGKGQVIDANMVEGSSYLSSWIWKTQDPSSNLPIWGNPPGENLLDGGAPFYQTYRTKDGKFMAVGAVEEQFYKEFLKGLNLSECDYPQFGSWEKSQKKFTEIFESKTQEEWCKIFDYKDACVTPVLSMKEAPFHVHNDARKSFMSLDGQNYFPQPAPILSRTPGIVAKKEPLYGEHTIDILTKIGYNDDDIKQFLKNGVAMSNNITSKY